MEIRFQESVHHFPRQNFSRLFHLNLIVISYSISFNFSIRMKLLFLFWTVFTVSLFEFLKWNCRFERQFSFFSDFIKPYINLEVLAWFILSLFFSLLFSNSFPFLTSWWILSSSTFFEKLKLSFAFHKLTISLEQTLINFDLNFNNLTMNRLPSQLIKNNENILKKVLYKNRISNCFKKNLQR